MVHWPVELLVENKASQHMTQDLTMYEYLVSINVLL